MNTINAITNTVAISQFNKGFAGKIFDEVKRLGAKVVMKNNLPECVLLSPMEYLSLIDEVEDARLLVLAMDRIKNLNSENLISEDEVLSSLGITQNELDSMNEVEIE